MRKADRRHRMLLGVLPFLALAALPSAVGAQGNPASAPAPTREEIDRASLGQPSQRTGGRLSVEGGPERAPCPLAAPQYADVKMTLAGVAFDNLKLVDPEALRSSWAEYAGREVPVATLCEIRDRAATMLRSMGYVAAVQVPPQRIEKGGTVRFDVLMAKLVSVQARGETGNGERLIAAHLERLLGEPAFNVHSAERELLLAGDLPGYDVRLTLRPANTVPGEVIGEVTVSRVPVELLINIQNFGSQAVGRFGGLARLQLNDLFGTGDSTSFSLFNTAQTREQTVLQGAHSLAVNSGGTRLGGDITYAWSRPSIPGGGLRSRTLIGGLGLTFPVVRSQARNLRIATEFQLINQAVDFAGTALSRDRLRILSARLNYDAIDPESVASTSGYSLNEPRWRVAASLELRHGIGGLGASRPCSVALCTVGTDNLSRSEADPSAFVVRAAGRLDYRPLPTIRFSLAPRVQYSPDILLAFEEYSVGNYTVGRGYDAGTLLGDSGAGIAAEIGFGREVPLSAKALAIHPFAFLDTAWVWNRDSAFNGLNPQRATSAGGGIRAAWGNHGRIDLLLAAPLKTSFGRTRRGDMRVLLSVTMQLVPWSTR